MAIVWKVLGDANYVLPKIFLVINNTTGSAYPEAETVIHIPDSVKSLKIIKLTCPRCTFGNLKIKTSTGEEILNQNLQSLPEEGLDLEVNLDPAESYRMVMRLVGYESIAYIERTELRF